MQDFVAQLEAELEKSRKQLEAAKKERERAAQVEAKWEQDVRALKNLIASRRKDSEGGTINIQTAAAGYSIADDPHYVSGYEELNRVEWTYQQIAKSGETGMLPTEIYEASQKAGFFMHKNYGYVATLQAAGARTRREGWQALPGKAKGGPLRRENLLTLWAWWLVPG